MEACELALNAANTFAPVAPEKRLPVEVSFASPPGFPNKLPAVSCLVNRDPELKNEFAGAEVSSPPDPDPPSDESSPPINPESSIKASVATGPDTKKEAAAGGGVTGLGGID